MIDVLLALVLSPLGVFLLVVGTGAAVVVERVEQQGTQDQS